MTSIASAHAAISGIPSARAECKAKKAATNATSDVEGDGDQDASGESQSAGLQRLRGSGSETRGHAREPLRSASLEPHFGRRSNTIPSFSILRYSACRETPSASAARETLPLALRRAISIWLRSIGTRRWSRADSPKPRSSAVMTSPALMTVARRMRFCSSRTLPGQSCASSALRAASPRRLRRLEKRLGERQHVLAPLAQRRHVELDDVEAEVEILAERAAGDVLAQVGVGGAEHAHVDAAGLARAEALELAALQDAQELHLPGRGEVADLVEEHRPAVGGLEAADAQARRAGVRARLRAEELTLDEVRRESRRRSLSRAASGGGASSAWMISAIFSFPAPFGPVISTGTSDGAICSASDDDAMHAPRSRRRCRADRASRASAARVRVRSSRSRAFSAFSARICRRLRTVATSFASSHGLAR